MRITDVNAAGRDNCPRGWKITSPTKVVEHLVTMLDVTLLISLLTIFHTIECVEW